MADFSHWLGMANHHHCQGLFFRMIKEGTLTPANPPSIARAGFHTPKHFACSCKMNMNVLQRGPASATALSCKHAVPVRVPAAASLRRAPAASTPTPCSHPFNLALSAQHTPSRRVRLQAKFRAEDLEQDGAEADVGAGDAIARSFAVQCAEIADETKCQDISVLHVAPHISWTSYMVFATVFSKPQLMAAMARIERMVTDEHQERERQNQPGSSPWECLDYGDVVVHLFTAEQREIYDIEGFYAAAEEIDLPWLVPAAPPSAQPNWSKQY